jgi:hypothetical protein
VAVTSGSVPNSPAFTFHTAGTYYWKAFYSGDANNKPTVSGCGTELLVVNQALPSISTALNASPIAINTSTFDTATLHSASGNAGGTVDYRFYATQAACQADASGFPGTAPSGGTDVGSVSVMAGSVPNSAAHMFSSAGSYYWAAFYSGDANNKPAVSGCGTEPLVVGLQGTATSVMSSQNPSTVSQQVTYTATVSPTPDGGTVAFADSGTTILGCGAVAVNTTTGEATCQATYNSPGSHPIVATYSGDTNYGGSASSTLTQTASQTNTATALSSSVNPSLIGQAVKFTATVTPVPDGGTVAFTDNGAALAGCGAVTVNTTTGAASCQVTYNAVGSHVIVAAYSGDSVFNASRSAGLTERPGASLALTGKPSGLTGQARLTLSCALNTGGCSATVALTASVKLHRHRHTVTVAMTAGGENVNVPAGQFSTVWVGLNSSAASVLKHQHKLLVTVTVTEGGVIVSTTKIVLTPPTINRPGVWLPA